MGDWIRNIFSDSLGFNGKKKGEDASKDAADGMTIGTMVTARSGSIQTSPAQKLSMDLLNSFILARDVDTLVSVLSKELPFLIPFDLGTIRWNPFDPQNEEWLQDMEDDFPEKIDFIGHGSIIPQNSSIEIDGQLEYDPDNVRSGALNGVCRIRTLNGDPVLIKIRSTLVVPLRREGRNIGTISLYSTKEGELSKYSDDPTISLIWKGLGNSLGIIIEMGNTISELRKTRELLDSTEDLLVLWKRSGPFWEIECNRKAERFMEGKDLGPEMMEGPFFAPPGREWERAMSAWRRALEDGETHQIDVELQTLESKMMTYMCTFSPHIVEGIVTGVKMTGIETGSIDKTVKIMGSSNKGYRLLLSLLSHDLKNPLSAIQGYSDLIRYADDEKKVVYTDNISRMVKRMSRTIMLAGMLSKVQNGNLDEEFTTMDISKTIGSAIESLQPRASEYDISFMEKEGEFLLDGHVFLEQVFIDLIDSAMKRSPKGSRIEIGLSTDLNGLDISVSDQGVGSGDWLTGDKVGPSSNKIGESGMDFGLAISKGIIDLHDGEIWVESNTPEGSIFHVDLPWSKDRSSS